MYPRIILAVLLLPTLILLIGCNSGSPDPVLPVEVRVGFVFANGDGEPQRRAVEMALSERDARSAGPRILPLYIETASDPEGARRAFAELVGEQRAHVILGPTWSSEARVAHPVAQGAGVPVLAVSNTAGGITDVGDYVFRVAMSEGEVIPEVVRSANDALDLSQVSLVYDSGDAFSKAVADVFRAEIERRGLRILREHEVSRDTESASEMAARVLAEAPDAVVVAALEAEAWGLLREMRKVSSIYVIGGSVFASPEMLQEYPEAANNLVFGVPWHSSSTETQNREFVENYHKAYGVAPDLQAAQAYAGMALLDAALERVDLEGKTLTESRNAIHDSLKSAGTVPTVLGPFSFSDKRNPKHAPSIMAIRNGKLEELK